MSMLSRCLVTSHRTLGAFFGFIMVIATNVTFYKFWFFYTFTFIYIIIIIPHPTIYLFES
jgi:hypothetical protein